MRTKLVLLVLLVALAALALLVSTAAARPAPVVAKTVSMLPASGYPWVQPIWRNVHGVVVVTLPKTISVEGTQPPAWVLSH